MSLPRSSAVPGTGRRIVPANLQYLAIYNPTLATNEDNEQDQIFFYHAQDSTGGPHKNEQLRQIGLAQGIVNLAAGFADGRHPDSVDTEKHRVVLKEIEADWWILASINLTCLSTTRQIIPDEPAVEYSAREVSPAPLLLQNLVTAWRIFLLHHGSSVQELYERLGQKKLVNLLDIYWSTFARDWDVLLHGNPAVDIYDGIKLAAGGELGVGVGEEDWGSSERDVLEDLVRNSTGVIDLVVSRFGEPEPDILDYHTRIDQQKTGGPRKWLGDLNDPSPTDGVVFSGVGKISRQSLRSLTDWVRLVYTYGEEAYGVRENPVRGRRNQRRTAEPPPLPALESTDESRPQHEAPAEDKSPEPVTQEDGSDKTIRGPTIPPPIVTATDKSLQTATAAVDASGPNSKGVSTDYTMGLADAGTWKKMLTLGYGSMWSIPGLQKDEGPTAEQSATTPSNDDGSAIKAGFPSNQHSGQASPSKPSISGGQFLIGLKGSLDSVEGTGESDIGELNSRIVRRVLNVDIDSPDLRDFANSLSGSRASTQGINSSVVTPTTSSKGTRLSVIIYIHQPFIYTFLLQPNVSMLSMPGFFRDIHKHLAPLHRGLLNCTSPENVAARLQSALPSESVPNTSDQAPIYELLYNPYTLTVHTSIPNIPMPGGQTTEGRPSGTSKHGMGGSVTLWTRVEALSVHAQVLQSFTDTRRLHEDREHHTKSNRGWWIVWMRLVSSNTDPQATSHTNQSTLGFREAILVRKASGHPTSRRLTLPNQGSRSSSFGVGRLLGLDSGTGSDSSNFGLTEGVGLDARRYVESLLSLNR